MYDAWSGYSRPAVLDEMTKQGEKMIKAIDASEVRDAALIVSGNQIEHYEIATYGSLIAFAQQLGFSEAVALLQEPLLAEVRMGSPKPRHCKRRKQLTQN